MNNTVANMEETVGDVVANFNKNDKAYFDFFRTYIVSNEYRPINEIVTMCNYFSNALLTPVSDNSTHTILGILFTYITYSDEDFVNNICNLIKSLLKNNEQYRYANVYDGRNIYQHIQHCCNLEYSDNDAQLRLIAQIAHYYIESDYECYVYDRENIEELNNTSLDSVFKSYAYYAYNI